MKQTIVDPKIDVEKSRYDETREKWFSLSDEDKVMHRLQFIAHLKYEYHKPFFEKLDIHQIINERWFRHYFESIYFADDRTGGATSFCRQIIDKSAKTGVN